jgi:hypothetical protein
MKLAKWKQEYIDSLRKMTNAELLDEAFQATNPDDYDGEFTEKGSWKADISRLELYERLQTQGFISEIDVMPIREFIGHWQEIKDYKSVKIKKEKEK